MDRQRSAVGHEENGKMVAYGLITKLRSKLSICFTELVDIDGLSATLRVIDLDGSASHSSFFHGVRFSEGYFEKSEYWRKVL